MIKCLHFFQEEGVSSTPYSPLASGRLVRDWDADTIRSKTDQTTMDKCDSTRDQDMAIVMKVKEIAKKRGISRTQVALAWLLSKKSGGSANRRCNKSGAPG